MTQPDILLKTRLFHVERLARTTADGTSHTREVIRHRGAVTIVPLIDDDHVCLIRNFRLSVNQTLLELPAGTREPGEPAIETASRELTEETGYRAGRVDPLTRYFVSPGILDERMHLFVARDLTPGPSALEPGEEIENQIMSWNDALAAIQSGAIQDAKTIIGLLSFHCFHRSPVEPNPRDNS